VFRNCTVPVGSGFLIPILTRSFFAQQTDPPEQRTEAFVRSQVTCVETAPVLSLTVDGVAIQNPKALLEKSTLFSVTLPPNNVFGVPPQVLSPSADGGYYAYVEPLSAGTHNIPSPRPPPRATRPRTRPTASTFKGRWGRRGRARAVSR
jgi:hypothetical protein